MSQSNIISLFGPTLMTVDSDPVSKQTIIFISIITYLTPPLTPPTVDII